MTTRLGTRTTLPAGFGVGVLGTVVLAFAFDEGSTFGGAVPGLVVSGVGQGVVWTAMWIAAATGVAPHEQGVASGLASTTLNLGNAVGLAVLIAVANADPAPHSDGGFVAVLLTAAGMAVGLVVALALPRRVVEREPVPA